MTCFFASLGIELSQAAKVIFQFLIFGICCQTAGALHHQTAENCHNQNAERKVQGTGSLAAQNIIYHRGGNNQHIRNPFINAKRSLVIHKHNAAKSCGIDIIILFIYLVTCKICHPCRERHIQIPICKDTKKILYITLFARKKISMQDSAFQQSLRAKPDTKWERMAENTTRTQFNHPHHCPHPTFGRDTRENRHPKTRIAPPTTSTSSRTTTIKKKEKFVYLNIFALFCIVLDGSAKGCLSVYRH